MSGGNRGVKINSDGGRVMGMACDLRKVVNQVDDVSGWTSLMYAASLNQEEMVRRLLLAGSDTRITSKEMREQHSTPVTEIGQHFSKRGSINKIPVPVIGDTAISISLDRGYTYLADMIRRGDQLAQERAGIDISRLMKFRGLKESQALELSKKEIGNDNGIDNDEIKRQQKHKSGLFHYLSSFF